MTTNTITQHAVDRFSTQGNRSYHMTTPALDIAEDLDNLVRTAESDRRVEVADTKSAARRTWLVLIRGGDNYPEYMVAVLRSGGARVAIITGATGFSGCHVDDVLTLATVRDRVRTGEYRVIGRIWPVWQGALASTSPAIETPVKPARLSPGRASQAALRNKDAREEYVRGLFREDISRPLQGSRGIDALVRAKFDNVGMGFYKCLELRDEVQKIERPGSGRPTRAPVRKPFAPPTTTVVPEPTPAPVDRLFLDLQDAVEAEAQANRAREAAEALRRAASDRTADLLARLTERRLGREVADSSVG
jgi:hypothetical protein